MILVEQNKAIVTITLNRPEVRNAFDEETIGAITACFKTLAEQKGVRAIVIRGAGPDFCAGADIRWMRRAANFKPAQSKKDASRLLEMCRRIDECPVPVIARVHGNCYGGGLGIVSASDIVVAADNAKLAFSECRLGILPAVVSTFVIPKIGVSQARRYFLTTEVLGTQAAKAIGLVHEVAPESELDGKINDLTQWILRAGPLAVREAKELIQYTVRLPRKKRIPHCVNALARVRASAEGREGLSAFLEKRPPAWTQNASPMTEHLLKQMRGNG